MWSFGLRIVPFLLASSPLTKEWQPQTPQDLSTALRQIYIDLEQPGARHKRITPDMHFSYVTPPLADGTSTWTQPHSDFNHTKSDELKKKPVALYLPGLDGYGMSAARHQFDDMARTFEFWRMAVLSNDRSSLGQMVNNVTDFVWELSENNTRKVVLVGESCGGLLAAAAAIKFSRRRENPLQGLVLVNPATSFDRTAWDSLVPLLTSLPSNGKSALSSLSNNETDEELTPYAVLGSLILSGLVPDNGQRMRILDTIISLPSVQVPPRNLKQLEEMWGAMSQSFRGTEKRLPPDLLYHRVSKWLDVGDSVVNERLGEIHVPTLVVVGEDDILMPSSEEGKKLAMTIQEVEKLEVKERGHFVLDDSVNLTEAILYSKIDPLNWKENKPRYDPVRDWIPPSQEQIEEAIEKSVKPMRQAFSPVFFSTDENGKRWKGLSKLPEKKGPLLFVGNHQLIGADLRILLPELIEKTDLFPRGLAHPIAFAMSNISELFGRTPGLTANPGPGQGGNADFQMFGAVQVSPKNYYKLMQTNQSAMLFPGGAREALTGNRSYPLFWPQDKTDFVRTAARFNATIVPFSAVGMAESATVLARYEDIQRIPFLGERARSMSANMTAARYDRRNESDFLADIVFPSMPSRNYFLFGAAVDTTDLDHNNAEECGILYKNLYQDVRNGLDDLMEARKKDPFQSTPRRILYERMFQKPAPTFPVAEINS